MTVGRLAESRLSTPVPDHVALYLRRARVADLLVISLWPSSAVAVGLFLVAGGTARFASIADAVTSVGIMIGLVGTNLVLSMPLLAIPDMPLAIMGIALLTVVVVSSLATLRRRFSYETWHLIHLMSYVAVLVSIPHQLSIGSVFSPLSFERAHWVVLYLLAFGAIFTHRFLEPLLSSIRHNLRVDRMVVEAPGVVSIHLRGHRLRFLHSSGGQFFVWRFWTLGTWWHSHPISLSSMATDTTMRITVRDLGEGSRSISAVRPGTRVWFEGPLGVFTDAGRTAKNSSVGGATYTTDAYLLSVRSAIDKAHI